MKQRSGDHIGIAVGIGLAMLGIAALLFSWATKLSGTPL